MNKRGPVQTIDWLLRTLEYLLVIICLYCPLSSVAMPFRSSLPPYLMICGGRGERKRAHTYSCKATHGLHDPPALVSPADLGDAALHRSPQLGDGRLALVFAELGLARFLPEG